MNAHEVLVTGATGFVGSRLCGLAKERGFKVRRSGRHSGNNKDVITREIGPDTDWSGALKDVATIVHLAARVHVMVDKALDPLSEFRRVNVDGTVNLARQAGQAGVRRFVFVSSVKVNGESTKPGKPFTIGDPPNPQDFYAMSKLEAEQSLRRMERETGLEVVIIRPPLVYGPGVKANFLRLMQGVQKGMPLPLGLVRNKRSLVALDNLVDLIMTCIQHPEAAGKNFLVSDGRICPRLS
jgi:nucleoside-diphosphate-sugar epimerase